MQTNAFERCMQIIKIVILYELLKNKSYLEKIKKFKLGST